MIFWLQAEVELVEKVSEMYSVLEKEKLAEKRKLQQLTGEAKDIQVKMDSCMLDTDR